jgi:hypothetical protein
VSLLNIRAALSINRADKSGLSWKMGRSGLGTWFALAHLATFDAKGKWGIVLALVSADNELSRPRSDTSFQPGWKKAVQEGLKTADRRDKSVYAK